MRNFQWTCFAVVASACLVMGVAVSAKDDRGQYYTTAQIEQLVAPLALYPDALLAQVFMASTYPYEVVEASRWARNNPRLHGDSLADALDGRDWDASVKSLVPFPDVLSRMADNRAWTQDLGDAFLIQPNNVMDVVQGLRHRAHKAGHLKTSPHQRVVVVQQVIQIVPVNRQIIYVPAYNPMVVYGPGWSHPTYYYPAMMAPPPYYVAGNVMSFGSGFPAGSALFGAVDWNRYNVYYGPNFYTYRGYRRSVEDWRHYNPGAKPGGNDYWKHNPAHRGPGGYSNKILDQKYGHGYPAKAGQSASPAQANSSGGHEQKPKGSDPKPGGNPQNRPGPDAVAVSHPGSSPAAQAKPAQPKASGKGEEKKSEHKK